MRRTKSSHPWKLTSLIGGVILAGGIAAFVPASTSAATHSRLKAAQMTCGAEGTPLEYFGGSVNVLGENSYADVFAGSLISECGSRLTIAIVPSAPDSRAFLNAVAALDTGNLPYTVRDVSRSWATLAELTNTLASVSWTEQKAAGLAIQGFGPDPSTDTVVVTLEAPAAQDLAAVDSEANELGLSHPAVTAATYPSLAAQVLTALYGGRFSVAPAYGAPLSLFANHFGS